MKKIDKQLLDSIKKGDCDLASILIEQGADIHLRYDQGMAKERSLIHLAVEEGCLDIAELLMDKGLNANDQDQDGDLPIHLASQQGNADMITLLVRHGAEVIAKNHRSQTALHFAALHGRKECAYYLIKQGLDVNDKDQFGYSALHWAAIGSTVEMVKLLIENGANLSEKDMSWKSLYELANKNNKKVAQFIKEIAPIIEEQRKLASTIKNGNEADNDALAF